MKVRHITSLIHQKHTPLIQLILLESFLMCDLFLKLTLESLGVMF